MEPAGSETPQDHAGAAEPEQSGRSDVVTIRRLLIDVSVIDPRGDDWASVPGIPRDAFELRLDGKQLTGDAAARVEFDEVCSGDQTAETLSETAPTILVVVDFNFLDPRLRHETAAALDLIAERMRRETLRIKVLGIGRRVFPLTHDFVTDPESIHAAAVSVRDLIAPMLPGNPGGENLQAPNTPPPNLFSGNNRIGRERDEPRSIDPFSFQVGARGPSLQNEARELTPLQDLAQRSTDPRPTLAALEGILLSHQHLRGRKAVVLFTSGWFDMSDELWLEYASPVRDAASNGFTLWAVEGRVADFGNSSSRQSSLLEYLSTGSGGSTIRTLGNRSLVFDRVLATQSCYYLFSIPVEAPERGREHHSIDVRLDTDRYPKYWRLRVRATNSVAINDEVSYRTAKRLAGLMEPSAYRFPEVRLSASYPSGTKPLETTIETAVMLPDLTFAPTVNGYVARFGWEGLVGDELGRTFCRIGDGIEREVRSEAPPARFPPALLVLRQRCELPGPGRYDIRVVIEDLSTGDVGAATALMVVGKPSATRTDIVALRLGRNSGRDFLLEANGKQPVSVPRDAKRTAFVPLAAGEPLDPEEQLLVRFVACGPAAFDPHAVVFAPEEKPIALFQIALARRGEQPSDAVACREYEGIVPQGSLLPGDYAVAIVDAASGITNRAQLDAALAAARALATLGFRVAPTATPPVKDDGRTASIGLPFRLHAATR